LRTYLVDGSNAVRRGGFDPRFPAVEAERERAWLSRLEAWAQGAEGRALVEVFFDGPRRQASSTCRALRLRFGLGEGADEMILGSARLLASRGRRAVVVTQDGGLAESAGREGARVMGFAEFEERFRTGRF
jgi:hypothetical protein